ncbi:hypothetical protein TKK_0007801 [Trichogramma kaykai]
MSRKRRREQSQSSNDNYSEVEELKKRLKRLKRKSYRDKKKRIRRRRRHYSSESSSSTASETTARKQWHDNRKPLKDSTNTKEVEKDQDFLNAIGKRLNQERVFAAPLREEIVSRWKDVIDEGLPDKEKEDIMKKYNLPENCKFSDPPKINTEIKTVVPQTVISRDTRIVVKQHKIVACLSAISKLFGLLTKDGRDLQDLPAIECLSDTLKLLADTLRDESMIRRSLIIANINTSLRDTITNTKCGEFLFGEKLDEIIKTAKAVAATVKDLRMPKKITPKPKNLNNPPRQPPRRNYPTSGGQKSRKPSNRNDKKKDAENRHHRR